MGFKDGKQVEPERVNEKRNNHWNHVVKESDKIVTIIDLCGHETYLKTTMFGLTGLMPDYAAIIVGANMGIQRMTKEHLGIALALKIPIFIIITKVDIAPEDVFKQTMDNLTKILKSPAAQKLPVVVKEDDDPAIFADNIVSDRVCPIFVCSSVKGTGIPQLKQFISKLTSREEQLRPYINNNNNGNRAEFTIDSVFNVKNVGIIASGTLVTGKVEIKQNLMLGPDPKGN
jgi:GTPase